MKKTERIFLPWGSGFYVHQGDQIVFTSTLGSEAFIYWCFDLKVCNSLEDINVSAIYDMMLTPGKWKMSWAFVTNLSFASWVVPSAVSRDGLVNIDWIINIFQGYDPMLSSRLNFQVFCLPEIADRRIRGLILQSVHGLIWATREYSTRFVYISIFLQYHSDRCKNARLLVIIRFIQ